MNNNRDFDNSFLNDSDYDNSNFSNDDQTVKSDEGRSNPYELNNIEQPDDSKHSDFSVKNDTTNDSQDRQTSIYEDIEQWKQPQTFEVVNSNSYGYYDDNANNFYVWNKDDYQKYGMTENNQKQQDLVPYQKARKKGFFGRFMMVTGGVLGWLAAVMVIVMFATGTIAVPSKNVPAISSEPGAKATTPQQTASSPITVASNGHELSNSDIAKKVSPTVVGIINKINSRGFGSRIVEQGSGSGIILNSEGYIVTNNHVIQGAQEITVVLNSSSKEYVAKLMGTDPTADLAVLKIEETDLPYIEFGDSSSLEVGDEVFAIGNPLGQELMGTFTHGVISAVNRMVTVENESHIFIQTDTAINPGNSGGALVNRQGELIGINTAKFQNVEGLGFAIPINDAKQVIDDLIKYGKVKSSAAVIGIGVYDVTEDVSQMYSLPIGVYVTQVNNNSGAEKSGLQKGDVIVKAGGETVKTTTQLNLIKSKYKPGDTFELEIVRQDKNMTVNVVLGESE